MSKWIEDIEENRYSAGHYHLEGYCAYKMGRTWAVKLRGCQAEGTDDPRETAVWRTSLNMVRDYIRTQLYN